MPDGYYHRVSGMEARVWVRSAYWVGAPKPGQEAAFRRLLDEELVPALRRLPGVSTARALWPRRREDDPPNLACQVVVGFASRDELERMLASAERQALRQRVIQARALFDGTLSHIDFEAGPQPENGA